MPPNIAPEMRHADFWLAKVGDPDALLIASNEIAAFNAHVYAALGIPPVLDLPDAVSGAQVAAWIGQYQPPEKTHYGPDGVPLGAEYWRGVQHEALPDLPERVRVEFGLALGAADVRRFPTADAATAAPLDLAFDELQESTVDVSWLVAALATSRSGRWRFCLTPHCWGWLRADAVAWGSRADVAAYAGAADRVTITARRALVGVPGVGGATPQMGTSLPLAEETEAAYRVRVAVRGEDGSLRVTDGWIAKADDSAVRGALPPTLRHVFEQAFKLLGEPYSWGGARLGIFGRDCSRFIRDSVATTGITLPRNGVQQTRVCRIAAEFTAEMGDAARTACLVESVPPGAILGMPGHVMLYLGAHEGVPYAIHDTSANGYSHVIVSGLELGADGPRGSLLSRLTRAVTVGVGEV